MTKWIDSAHLFTSFCLVLTLCLRFAEADTVAIGPSKDNTLYEDAAGGVSNGAGNYFFAGATGTGAIRRGLVAFDIAGIIPAGMVIDSASLTLHMSMTTAVTVSVGLHKALADWGEGTSNASANSLGGTGEGAGAPAATGDATWLHRFFDTDFWTNEGGDFSSGASATTSVGGLGFYIWSSAGMAADVQGWLDEPSTNFGWLVKGNEATIRTSKRFDSREFNLGISPEAMRPVLTVTFAQPTAAGNWELYE